MSIDLKKNTVYLNDSLVSIKTRKLEELSLSLSFDI